MRVLRPEPASTKWRANRTTAQTRAGALGAWKGPSAPRHGRHPSVRCLIARASKPKGSAPPRLAPSHAQKGDIGAEQGASSHVCHRNVTHAHGNSSAPYLTVQVPKTRHGAESTGMLSRCHPWPQLGGIRRHPFRILLRRRASTGHRRCKRLGARRTAGNGQRARPRESSTPADRARQDAHSSPLAGMPMHAVT
jgi:hypothetical protein